MNFLFEQLHLITTQFHWLRPAWLFTLIPAVIVCIFLWKQKRKAYQWQQLIAPELLPFLLDDKTVHTPKSLLWGLLFAWIISSIAIAGPAWIKRPTPVEKNQNALVILLDLSYSMISEDIKPSRIARARLKIADMLRNRKDGQTALVAYAGEAHTVTPISDDSATMVSLLSSMHPNIMPLQGSNTEDAVTRGIQLLHHAGATQGDLLLVTDGVVSEAFDKIQSLLSGQKIQLNILGIGTTQPAPIPSTNGGFLRDNSGTIITTQLNSNELTQLAQRVNGRFHEITSDNSDLTYLKPRALSNEDKPTLQRDFDQWIDQGHWFIFLLLPIALVCFRRGLLLSLLLIPIVGLNSSNSYALGVDDAWLTKDQQAQHEFKNGDAKKAAEQFQSPEWKASAQYRAGDYVGAAETFAKIDTASAQYNRGNALAKSGKLEEAIKAYNDALKRDADLDDAKKNRTLIEKLKQQKDQHDNDKNKDDKNTDEQNKDNKDQDKQNQDSKNTNSKDPQDNSKQDENKQQKDQQNNNQQEKDNQYSKNQDGNHQKDQQQNNSQSSANNAAQDSAQQRSVAHQAQSSQSSSVGQQPSAAQTSATATSGANAEQQALHINQDNLSNEQKQALEQWLRRVPDDPGGLLRNKFKYQYQLNRQKQADGDLKTPSNNADQRL